MFKIAKATKTAVQFRTDAGVASIEMRFLWLPVSKRLEIMEAHDKEVAALPEGEDAPAAERAKALAMIHAVALYCMAEGWDLAYEDGRPVPWTAEAIAEVLDWMPGLWLHILTAAGKATSFEAIEGN